MKQVFQVCPKICCAMSQNSSIRIYQKMQLFWIGRGILFSTECQALQMLGRVRHVAQAPSVGGCWTVLVSLYRGLQTICMGQSDQPALVCQVLQKSVLTY